jgi:hypothetical protein
MLVFTVVRFLSPSLFATSQKLLLLVTFRLAVNAVETCAMCILDIGMDGVAAINASCVQHTDSFIESVDGTKANFQCACFSLMTLVSSSKSGLLRNISY